MNAMYKKRSGAVSIFVVIFTMLLITIVTMSFARLMLREQQKASDSDLSQSAYDAALAGVEDAKRALTVYAKTKSSINLNQCNRIAELLGGDPSSEVAVGDAEMNQAYTCVKVLTETEDYLGDVGSDQVRLVPLQSADRFDRVIVEWFSRDDLSTGAVPGAGLSVNLPNTPESQLIPQSDWPVNRPPVLEAQLIQTADSFKVSDFDRRDGNKWNTNTLFLYPKSSVAGSSNVNFSYDERPHSGEGLTDVNCVATLNSAAYSCRAVISLPAPVGGNADSRKNSFLRLTPRYSGTHFRVTLQRGSGSSAQPVNFDGVQPSVDSTGRASDLFRRVSARVEVNSSATYPEAAVDVSGNFCKVFMITDKVADYNAYPSVCTP